MYRTIAKAGNQWTGVHGPTAATIATLLDIGWKPITPHQWITPQDTIGDFMREEGVSQFEVMQVVHQQLEDRLWSNAAQVFGGRGLETGTPFTPASKAHKELLTKGLTAEAKALEHIIVNKSWAGERPTTQRHHRRRCCSTMRQMYAPLRNKIS